MFKWLALELCTARRRTARAAEAEEGEYNTMRRKSRRRIGDLLAIFINEREVLWRMRRMKEDEDERR